MKKERWIIVVILLVPLGLLAGCEQRNLAATIDKNGRHDAGDEHDHDEKQAHAHDRQEPAHADDAHDTEITLSPEGVKKAGLRIEAVGRHRLVETILAPARVAFNAESMAHVGSPVSGRISEIKVRIGDKVKKGDPLLIVQSPDLAEAQSDYLLKRMAAEAAGPVTELAKLAHDRAKTLHLESQGIALTEVQKREAEYQTALGAQLTAQAQATAAANRLQMFGMDQQALQTLEQSREIAPYYIIHAPISGQVIQHQATLGELVNPDRQALLVLADMSTLWVLADVPESRMNKVAPGAKARVSVLALPGKSLEGTVSFIAAALDHNTRTISVRIEIKANDQRLSPGMFAQALIVETGEEENHEPVLAIPEQATQLIAGEQVVFTPVEGEENTFAMRPVKVGPAVGQMLPIISGLDEGEHVVTAGSFILKAEHGKGTAGHEH